jgi:hypothetical protein
MRNLLAANFSRLWHDKMFRIGLGTMFIGTVCWMLRGVRTEQIYHDGRNLDYYYFQILPYYGLILAIFIAKFIGTDYEDGTIRNKCIIGHSRSEIYIANLLTCCLCATLLFVAWAVGGLVGIPYFGLWSVGISGYIQLLLLELLTVWALTAFLVAIAQVVTSRFSNIMTVFAAMILLMLGSYFYNALCEPETIIDGVTITADKGVVFGDEIANPGYIGGALRTVYRGILNILPTGQQIWIAHEKVMQPVLMGMWSLIIIMVFTEIGLWLFLKKDIR